MGRHLVLIGGGTGGGSRIWLHDGIMRLLKAIVSAKITTNPDSKVTKIFSRP